MTTNAQAALAAAALHFQPPASIVQGNRVVTSPSIYDVDHTRVLNLAGKYLLWLDRQDKEQAAKKELEAKGSIEERLERVEARAGITTEKVLAAVKEASKAGLPLDANWTSTLVQELKKEDN